MSGYIGPIPVPQGVQEKETFTATAAQTTFGTKGYTDGSFINVFLNGVRLVNGTDYTATNGSDVVLASGANAGDVLDFETINQVQLVSNTSTTPIFKTSATLKNDTEEDTDGGRESTLIFQGEQSGGEISTLAEIEASHDGTADDQKGDLIFRTNDGSDNNAPTERLRIDSNGSIITATLGTDNTHLGEGAGAAIVSGGTNNTLIGKDAGTAITTGDANVAIGYQALDANTTGGNSVAVGSNALGAQTTGDRNIGIGSSAGAAITTGQGSIAIGHEALASATTGDDNIAIGCDSPTVNAALEANTTGLQNVAVGGGALAANTTANEGTAFGYKALNAVTTGFGNTAIGANSGKAVTTTDRSTYLGNLAGADTTGRANTFLGCDAGYLITSGAKNTLVGRFNGNQGGLDLRTTDNYVVLSDGSGTPRFIINENGYTSAGALGANPGVGTSRHKFCQDLGNNVAFEITHSSTSTPYGMQINFNGSSPDNTTNYFINCVDTTADRFRVESDGDVQNHDNSYGAISDVKLKENIADASSQWDDIKAVQVRKYSMKSDNSDTANRIGVIAQELEASGMNGLVKETTDLSQDDNGNIIELETTTKTVKYSILYMKAIKALQEAMTRIETLETEMTSVKSRLDALEAE